MSAESDKGVIGTATEEAKGALVEAYRDVGRPVLAPVGQVAGGVVNLVLWPVKLALDSANAALGKLSARVEQKHRATNVPPERQIAAPATVAGPAALQYALLGDGEEVADLRDMFENLLARSMDAETTASVHPAFVGMLSQMTPDEARILKSIKYRVYPAYEVNLPDGDAIIPHGLRTQLGSGLGIDTRRLERYLTNLDRLGIVRIEHRRHDGAYYGYVALADELKQEFPGTHKFPGSDFKPTLEGPEGGADSGGQHPGNMLAEAESGFEPFNLTPKALVVTPFGQSFLETCTAEALAL